MTKGATHSDALSILSRMENMLLEGRPRKLPYKPRPRAVTLYLKEPVSPINPKAGMFSLEGAFQRAVYDIRAYSPKTTRWRAKGIVLDAIIDAAKWPALQSGIIGKFGGPLGYIDNVEEDTREIIRIVRRARRNLERG